MGRGMIASFVQFLLTCTGQNGLNSEVQLVQLEGPTMFVVSCFQAKVHLFC
jgi:hypothetical protein